MAKRKKPIQRIGLAYKSWLKWKNIKYPIFFAILVYLFDVWRDNIVEKYLSMLANWLSSNIYPLILGVFQDHPYLFGFYVFLLINIGLLIHAYFTSGPPRGLKIIDKKIDSTVRVVVKNNTGDDLVNCEARVLCISLLDGKEQRYKSLGLNPTLRWYSRGFPEGKTTEIKDKTEGIFGIVSYTKFKNEREILVLDIGLTYKIFEGRSKVEILFGGNTKTGEIRNYKLDAIIDYDGKCTAIEIWI